MVWPLVAVLLGLVVYIALYKGGGTGRDLWKVDLSGLKADLVLTGVTYTREENGKVKWVVRAARARLFEDKDLLDLSRVDMEFFTPRGERIVVEADNGTYDLSTEDLFLKGDVKVTSPKGESLFTDSMHYASRKDTISSRDRVLLKGGGFRVEGKGFEYDLKQGKFMVRDQTAVVEEGGIEF